MSDWKGCRDPPLPRPHLRVGSGDEGALLMVLAYLRPLEGKQLLFFISVLKAIVFEQILTWCSLGPCFSAATVVLSIALCMPRLGYLAAVWLNGSLDHSCL